LDNESNILQTWDYTISFFYTLRNPEEHYAHVINRD